MAPKVIRWRLQLQEYDFVISHIRGSDNVVADFLSRFPPGDAGETLPGVKPLTVDHDDQMSSIHIF